MITAEGLACHPSFQADPSRMIGDEEQDGRSEAGVSDDTL
jgi:hypothetical protein